MLEASFRKKLWHFTLEIKIKSDNQIVVLWGPSGSGKTTVLHCLAGLFNPSSGSIRINDRIIYSSEQNINVPTRFRNIGYLFQDYALFPHMTVKENVLYGLKSRSGNNALSAQEPMELLNFFGVGHLVNRYPRQLSGGEKQRVALARALVVRPELLLLDEPFSALDKRTRISLRHELKNLHRRWQIPFILVTHDEEEAEFLGDEIISLEKGKSKKINLLRTTRS
ncbi:ABC transporter ATP-binding protein [Desulforamulus putei]|uniref:Molybdate transport system ATP-binding protein n=1 Tax=Desulforamulus putei DSM 12395 TaxID=1121429 RepID=A0A1M4T3E3_9FIRM|nr:ATP-binding cassette domain-containing protein [Desulforamulus putei]SHE39003.1 molybdate transport system ATP-binding protein [Desulforamulus putei DSM 12395]